MSTELLGAVRPHFQPAKNFVRFRVSTDLAGMTKEVVGDWWYTVRTVGGGRSEKFRPLSDTLHIEDVGGAETVLSFGSSETIFESAEGLQVRLERELGASALPEPLTAGIVLVNDPAVSLNELPLALFTQLRRLGMGGEQWQPPRRVGKHEALSDAIVDSIGFSYLFDDRTNVLVEFPAAVWQCDRGVDGKRFSLFSPGKHVVLTVRLQQEVDRMRLEGWDYLETGVRKVVEKLAKTPFRLRLNEYKTGLEMDVPALPEYDRTIPTQLGLEPDFSLVLPATK